MLYLNLLFTYNSAFQVMHCDIFVCYKINLMDFNNFKRIEWENKVLCIKGSELLYEL